MNSGFGMRPGIILLREGTDTSQGKPQLVSNMNACQAVADAVRTTLGPRGMDKLVTSGNRTVISNDGATLMKLLEIAHPAAKTLVDISVSQDKEVGDGTTSVVLIAAEILMQVKAFVQDSVHPQIIIKFVRLAGKLALEKLTEMQVTLEELDKVLLQCASTALNSKLIANHQDLFAPMVVEAVKNLGIENLDELEQWVGMVKVPGGDVRQSFLVPKGVAFAKTFSYAGFEQMKKKFTSPKILLLNVELELKAEKENAEVRIESPSDYQSIVQAEWDVIYEKLDNCVDSGANIVLSKLPIGDLATQYFADRGLFCAGRVANEHMTRVARATGATIQTTTRGFLDANILGSCGLFEERAVGEERFNVFEDCPNSLTSTLVLRGGSEQFIAESERSVHDALMVVKRCWQGGQSVVAGGGAVEMELAHHLKEHALTIKGKGQLIVAAYAKALEVIPRQLCDNAGFESTDMLAALRKRHSLADNKWIGVDLDQGDVCDTYAKGIWEPSDNKRNSIGAATEAACVILSIDETIISPRSQDPSVRQSGQLPPMGGMGSNPMGNAMDKVNADKGGSRSGNFGNGVSWMKGRGGG